MKWISLLVSLCFLSLSGFSQDKDLQSKVTGSWAGPLKIQTFELTVVLNVSFNEKDSLIVTIDSPSQGAKDIPTSSVTLSKDSLIVKSKMIMSTFRGAFLHGYDTLAGTWKQGGISLPLTLVHQKKPFAFNRPQEPKPPYPYMEREVTIPNKNAEITLAGTLTWPKEGGPFPAVILITGSGPQNRDEELLGHKPFLLLADYLTRQGIAVLRYDDRGTAKSTGNFATATTFTFANDVSAAVDFLKKQPEIDTSHIGLIGHSEGGIIAPIVASERDDIHFIILMAGPGITGENILLMQSELISRANGTSEEDIRETLKLNKKIYSILKKEKDTAKAGEKIIQQIFDFNKKHEKKEGKDTINEAQARMQVKQLTSPWFRVFLTLDPQIYLTKVKCPLLALNGERDMQVPPKENLEAIEKAMIIGGNFHYSIEMIPGVNHLFQHAATGNPSEYVKIEETMAPEVLEMIAKWIGKTILQ